MKEKIKILIADKINTDEIESFFPDSKYLVTIIRGRNSITNEEIISEFGNYDVLIIRSVRKINKEFIQRTNFKVIATCSRGTENIDTDFAEKIGIVVFGTDKGNSIAAAEHTIGMIISYYKNFSFSSKLIEDNKFNFNDFRRNELNGKTIGIIGFGNIGSRVGKLSKAFEMNVLANDISGSVVKKYQKKFNFVSLKKLLSVSDIVTLHIPGSIKNNNFIDMKKLSMLKKECLIVNTSRGNVINESELIRALKENKIRGAALDVFKNEPEISKELLKLKNVLLTNHIAGKTRESSLKMASEVYKKVLQTLK